MKNLIPIHVILMCAMISLPLTAPAAVVIDNSPAAHGSTTLGDSTHNLSNLTDSNFIGDRFTLTVETLLTGGAIFSNNDSIYGALNDSVRFRIYSGISGTVAPLYDLSGQVDVIDTTDTGSFSGDLTRKHVTLGSSITLPAGTYWFSMPGDSAGVQDPVSFAVQTTSPSDDYDDGAYGHGNGDVYLDGTLPDGDMYFQLEGSAVPEPATAFLLGLGAAAIGFVRRKRS